MISYPILYPTAFLIQVDRVVWLLNHKLRTENARANLAIDPDYHCKLEAAKSKQPKAIGCSDISPETQQDRAIRA
jgi:hypothetical protein